MAHFKRFLAKPHFENFGLTSFAISAVKNACRAKICFHKFLAYSAEGQANLNCVFLFDFGLVFLGCSSS